jgi:hypothetical protein
MQTKRCHTLVYTDPGADADDQLAIREALLANIPITLVVGGAGKLAEWEKFNALEDPLSEPVPEPVRKYDNGKLNVILKPRFIVVIAPGIDTILENLDLSDVEKIYYMGNKAQTECTNTEGTNIEVKVPDTSGEGFNDVNAGKFMAAIRGKPIRVVTSKESESLMCNINLFEKLGLSDKQITRSIKSAFTLILGRMNPSHKYNGAAEGLISEFGGKRANNKKGLLDLVKSAGISTAQIKPPNKLLKDACKNYMDTLQQALSVKKKKLGNYEQALKGLLITSMAATAVLGQEPLDEHGNLIYSSEADGTPYNLADKWSDQYKILDDLIRNDHLNLAPAFDLLTVRYLIGDLAKTVNKLSGSGGGGSGGGGGVTSKQSGDGGGDSDYLPPKKSSVFETGVPANGFMVGSGEFTRGLVVCVKDEQKSDIPSLTGRFKLTANYEHADHLIEKHLQKVVSSETMQNMRMALINSKSKSFENLRVALLKEIGVSHNAKILNALLFHPSQWTAL